LWSCIDVESDRAKSGPTQTSGWSSLRDRERTIGTPGSAARQRPPLSVDDGGDRRRGA
jgi:hypothetical protein